MKEKTSASLSGDTRRLVDVLARRERGRLIASLVQRLGSQHLALAEDVAQEALLAALALWPYEGVPDNPAAWLTRVAQNKSIDQLRRKNKEQLYDPLQDERIAESDTHLHVPCVEDPDLHLMFLCCHPSLDASSQLVLTLRVVSGFTAREIAEIFLATETATAQRLSRSRRTLKALRPELLNDPTRFDINSRLDAVLKVIYLMFCLGYAPRSGQLLIRKDVALEALRLSQEIADRKHTGTHTAKALAALLCFQASRLDAREDSQGQPILLKDQDRTAWDYSLIRTALAYLKTSAHESTVSRYHLEAGIAAAYAISSSWGDIDWPLILKFHERLQLLVNSPVITISRCVAQAFAGEPMQALQALDQLASDKILKSYAPYHIARAETLRLLNREAEAQASYATAIAGGASAPVLRHLQHRLASAL